MLADVANSIIIVDLPTIKRNVEKIRKHIGPDVELMVTAKSNGYGHGLIEPFVYLHQHANVNKFSTSMVSEAVELREAGVDCFMMVLGGIPYKAIPAVIKYDLVVSVYDNEFAKLLSDESLKNITVTEVHSKINTGLRCIGVHTVIEL